MLYKQPEGKNSICGSYQHRTRPPNFPLKLTTTQFVPGLCLWGCCSSSVLRDPWKSLNFLLLMTSDLKVTAHEERYHRQGETRSRVCGVWAWPQNSTIHFVGRIPGEEQLPKHYRWECSSPSKHNNNYQPPPRTAHTSTSTTFSLECIIAKLIK